MARFDRDGGRVPTTLFECAAWHMAVQVTCLNARCRRIEVFDPHQLWWKFHCKHWDDRLARVGHRLRCKACSCGGSVHILRKGKATITLPWPDEREWKRAVNRFRG